MTFGSLFTGIGGLDLGLERAGMAVRWQVECDPFCQRVLARHWPEVKRYGDVREVSGLEPVDLIAGGFPCQDISYAGKGGGLDGERSGLWHEFARIIRDVGPRFVLVENVPALVRRGLDAILGTLADCGYDAEWESVPASAVGAPHLRERTFIVAYADRERSRIGESGALCKNTVPDAHRDGQADARGRQIVEPWTARDAHATDVVRQRASRLVEAVDSGTARQGWPCSAEDMRAIIGSPFRAGRCWPQPLLRRVDDGFPDRVDQLQAIGNAVVPHVAEWIGHRIMKAAA